MNIFMIRNGEGLFSTGVLRYYAGVCGPHTCRKYNSGRIVYVHYKFADVSKGKEWKKLSSLHRYLERIRIIPKDWEIVEFEKKIIEKNKSPAYKASPKVISSDEAIIEEVLE